MRRQERDIPPTACPTSDYGRDMASAGDVERSTDTGPTEKVTFELERFAWVGPEQLEVVGTFAGLWEPPTAAPMLVVHGGGGSSRLPLVLGSNPEPPMDRRRWRAAFAWRAPPVPVASAELVFGDQFVIGLPVPGERRPLFRSRTLEVRRPGAAHEPSAVHDDAPHGGEVAPGEAAERLRLQVELAAAREEIRELRLTTEAAVQDGARAREDLEAERLRHAGDTDRYREELERLRRSADEALVAEQNAARAMATELQEARGALEAADVELRALRGRVTAFESAAQQAEQLRSELADARERVAAVEAERDRARSVADDVRAEGRTLLARLEAVRRALDEG